VRFKEIRRSFFDWQQQIYKYCPKSGLTKSFRLEISFHRGATGNTGAFEVADGGSPKVMGNPVTHFFDQLAIR
jgi:hypothetical protein